MKTKSLFSLVLITLIFLLILLFSECSAQQIYANVTIDVKHGGQTQWTIKYNNLRPLNKFIFKMDTSFQTRNIINSLTKEKLIWYKEVGSFNSSKYQYSLPAFNFESNQFAYNITLVFQAGFLTFQNFNSKDNEISYEDHVNLENLLPQICDKTGYPILRSIKYYVTINYLNEEAANTEYTNDELLTEVKHNRRSFVLNRF
ncbi:MAG: hypothetical protein IPM51_04760 [Sphingobacteriaceae bacterium]|nr:hypothetical protein [Sphingobacteriaceae bacterium]